MIQIKMAAAADNGYRSAAESRLTLPYIIGVQIYHNPRLDLVYTELQSASSPWQNRTQYVSPLFIYASKCC